MSIYQQQGESLSNDDIITDMISEIKIEKTLLRETKNIDEVVAGNHGKYNGDNDAAGGSKDTQDDNIDPQLVAKHNEKPEVDAQMVVTQNHSLEDINENIEEVSFDQVEEEEEENSTWNITEPALSPPYVDHRTTTSQHEANHSDTEKNEENGDNVANNSIFSFDDNQGISDRLAIVQLDESDEEDMSHGDLGDGMKNFNLDSSATINDPNKKYEYNIGMNAGEQCKLPNSNSFSIGGVPVPRSGAVNLVDEMTDIDHDKSSPSKEWKKIDSLKNEHSNQVDAQYKGIDASQSNLNQNFDELNIISAMDSDHSSSMQVAQNNVTFSPSSSGGQNFTYNSATLPSRGLSRGTLRLITSGSSVEDRISSNHAGVDIPVGGTSKIPENEISILSPNAFHSNENVPLNTSNFHQNRGDLFLEELEKIKSSFDLRSTESNFYREDDRLFNSQTFDEGHQSPKGSQILHNNNDHIPNSGHNNNAVSSSDSEPYSGSSMINILANNFNRGFPNSSLSEEPKGYSDLKDKDDWIKSLNSAFELDADFLNEIEEMNNRLQEIDSYVDSSPHDLENLQQSEDEVVSGASATPGIPSTIKRKFSKARKTQDSADIGKIKPQSADSNISNFQNDKQMGFFSRLSSRINSASGAFLKSSGRGNLEPNLDSHVADLLATDLTSNNLISPLGTLTAKLFEEENGIEPKDAPREELRHFVETITSPTSSKSPKSLNILMNSKTPKNPKSPKSPKSPKITLKKLKTYNKGTLDNYTYDDGEREDEEVNETSKLLDVTSRSYWRPNNRFMDFNSKKSIRRKDTIKKIFTSKSKDSAGTVDNPPSSEPITRGEDNGKLSWKKSILRRTSTFKKPVRPQSEDVSMDSGFSLSGFAAEYARTHTFDISESNEIFTTTTTDARKIIDLAVFDTEETHEGFLDISNEVPVTRDTQFSASDDTLGSYLQEKLNSPRSVAQYIPTPVPRGRSFSLFYRKRHVPISIIKRNKSFDNTGDRLQTIRFAPSPNIKRLSRDFFSNRRNSGSFDGTEEPQSPQSPESPLSPRSILKKKSSFTRKKKGSNIWNGKSLLKRWKSSRVKR